MSKTHRPAERPHVGNSRGIVMSSRRDFIAGGLALLSTSTLFEATRGRAADGGPEPRVAFPVVETTAGKIRGRSQDGVATIGVCRMGDPPAVPIASSHPSIPRPGRACAMHSSWAAPAPR